MFNSDDPRRNLFGKISFSVVLGLLAAMIMMATLLAIGELTQDRNAPTQSAAAVSTEPSTNKVELIDVRPATPWQPLDADTTLTRIGVGSCLHQNHPQPIWSTILESKPDLFVMLGDNVYGDIRQGDPNELARAYIKQHQHGEFAEARAAFPFLAIWDDHDYGANDAGGGYEFQAPSAELFRTFWGLDDAKADDGGIYYARTVGPEGRRLQFIFLDTRTFRSPLARKDDDFPHWGKYQPDPDDTKTLLGDVQWQWLEGQLKTPADVRIIASSIQVLANGHGWERWGNLPAERDRLMQLLEASGATGLVLISGDRHAAAHYRRTINAGAQSVLPELTASSLNRSFGPSRDARVAPLVSGPHHQENFGLIEIDWEGREIRLGIRGLGDLDDTVRLSFGQLGIGTG